MGWSCFLIATMSDSALAFVTAIACLIIFLCLAKRLSPNGRPPLPPGPSVISLIGQAFKFKASSSAEDNAYSRWAHKYGDIVHMSILNRHLIIINSAQMAIDMLESKGSIYSGRELTPMLKLVGWGDIASFSQPGPFLKQQRGYMHRLFGTRMALSTQHGIIEDESRRFLRQVMDSPENLADCIKSFAGSIVLRISYGYNTKEQDDPFISRADRAVRELTLVINPHTLPWMVDIFPSMEKLPSWLPGTRFKKLAKQWSDHLQEVINAPFQLVKEQMAAGTAVPSFTSTLLADGNLSPEDERAIKMASMTIYVAGSDRTVFTIQGFFLTMALNPAAFKKAQEEIDTVVGTQRLPSISDRVNLHYTNALISELFRFFVVVSKSIAHKTTQDDMHTGYFIPKGSIILPNIQLMLSDPRQYKDPEQFMPERFLGENPERDPREMAFGFGRRQCPGRLLVDETVFSVCAMSIAVFDIQKKVKDGVIVESIHHMVPGFVSHPTPYEIDVRPRSAEAVALIQTAV